MKKRVEWNGVKKRREEKRRANGRNFVKRLIKKTSKPA